MYHHSLGGCIAQCDTPRELLARPASMDIARFLGMPNFVPCRRDEWGEWSCVLGVEPGQIQASPGVAVGWAELIGVGSVGTAGAPGTVIAVEHRGLGQVIRCRVGSVEVVGIADVETSWQTGDAVAVRLRRRRPHVLLTDEAKSPLA